MFEPLVGFFEDPQRVLDVVRMLFECFGVPLASRCREEIARVDVDGSRQLVEGVADGVDDGLAEDKCFFRVQLLAALLAQAALLRL